MTERGAAGRWWAAAVLALALAACNAAELTPRTALAASTGNAPEILRLMHGSVVDGGLWFEDPACFREFPTARVVPKRELPAFARCLAGLHLRPSKRTDSLQDVEVLDYGPGIEVEALMREMVDEPPQLLWIGYASRDDVSGLPLPSLAPDALEALRTAGNPTARLAPNAIASLTELAAHHGAYAWLKLCLDDTGKITTARAVEASSLAAARVFRAATSDWRFRPFVVDHHILPTCSLVAMTYPREKPGNNDCLPVPAFSPRRKAVVIDGRESGKRRVSGRTEIEPDDGVKRAIAAARIQRLTGLFELCLDTTGHVSSVQPLSSTGSKRYDHELMRGISTWVYKPYIDRGHAVPVCTLARFIYTQD